MSRALVIATLFTDLPPPPSTQATSGGQLLRYRKLCSCQAAEVRHHEQVLEVVVEKPVKRLGSHPRNRRQGVGQLRGKIGENSTHNRNRHEKPKENKGRGIREGLEGGGRSILARFRHKRHHQVPHSIEVKFLARK